MDKKNPALVIVIVISLITLFMVINTNFSLTNEVVELRAMISDIKGESSGKQTDDDLMAALDEIRVLIEGAVDRIGELSSESGMDDSSVEVSGIVDKMDNLISQIDEMTAKISNTVDKSDVLSREKELSTMLGQLEGFLEKLKIDLQSSIFGTESSLNELKKSLNKRLVEIERYLPIIEQIQTDVRNLVNSVPSSDEAELFLKKAMGSEYPDLYYLAAIYHEPSNSVYYEQYLNYLEESGAEIDSYIMLGTIIENSIMSMAYDETENLLSVYETIMGIVSEDIAPAEPELSIEESLANWDTAVNAFYAYATSTSFSYNEFSDLYNAVVVAESYISDILTYEEETKYDAITSIYALISSAQSVYVIASNMEESPDSVFSELYPLTLQSLDGVVLFFASRDKSIESKYATVITDNENKIIEAVKDMDQRYDNLKITAVERELSSILSTTLNHSELQKRYNEIYIKFGTMMQGLRRAEDFSERIAEIQDSLEKISRQIYAQNYSRYQQWAGRKIDYISKQMKSEKEKEDKLLALATAGYFDIDSNLLIPELATAYSSLWDEDYVKNSSRSVDYIFTIYPVNKKMLGEV